MKRLLMLGIFSVFFIQIAYALELFTIQPTLQLDGIKAISPQEYSGDELYFEINRIRSNQTSQFFKIPEPPLHWTARHLDKLRDIPLWSEPLNDGDSVTLIIALLEADSSVFNPDDLLGTVRLTIKNNHGKLQLQWQGPNQSSQSKKREEPTQQFKLTQHQAEYEVRFTVKP